MNPKGVIFSEPIEIRTDGSYTTKGEPIVTFIYREEMPKTVRDDPMLKKQWLNTNKFFMPRNNEKTLAEALNDYRQRYNWMRIPNLHFPLFSFDYLPRQQEYYCKPAVINGFSIIDTFDIKNKNKRSKVNKREQLKNLKEKGLEIQDSIRGAKEEIEELHGQINAKRFGISIAETELSKIRETIQSLEKELAKPKIYRIKPLPNGRLYIELKGEHPKRRSAVIDKSADPFSAIFLPDEIFERAYISLCGTKICWDYSCCHKPTCIDIEAFSRYFS